jgi:hypothetical protein
MRDIEIALTRKYGNRRGIYVGGKFIPYKLQSN